MEPVAALPRLALGPLGLAFLAVLHLSLGRMRLALGVLGGLFLIAILFYPLIKTDRQVELYALFLLNTLLFFFSESVLETQAGTVGFTLFYVLYFSIAKQSKTESN